mmetsp:Transcript_80888/g.229027  ORF Transcript_80888/g.229027 Transcript_80888/m.229027 type:complete len:231 (+) Transcript_80888:659-1351(+)
MTVVRSCSGTVIASSAAPPASVRLPRASPLRASAGALPPAPARFPRCRREARGGAPSSDSSSCCCRCTTHMSAGRATMLIGAIGTIHAPGATAMEELAPSRTAKLSATGTQYSPLSIWFSKTSLWFSWRSKSRSWRTSCASTATPDGAPEDMTSLPESEPNVGSADCHSGACRSCSLRSSRASSAASPARISTPGSAASAAGRPANVGVPTPGSWWSGVAPASWALRRCA